MSGDHEQFDGTNFPLGPRQAGDPLIGFCSKNIWAIFPLIKQMRTYLRGYGKMEGLCRDYTYEVNFRESMSSAIDVQLEFLTIAKMFGISIEAIHCTPFVFILLMHGESQQWISLRGHVVNLGHVDNDGRKLLCENDILLSFFTPSLQPNFEDHIAAVAEEKLKNLGW